MHSSPWPPDAKDRLAVWPDLVDLAPADPEHAPAAHEAVRIEELAEVERRRATTAVLAADVGSA